MSLLLQDFKNIQEKAHQEQYAIIKKEFIDRVAKSPFQPQYYVGRDCSESVCKVIIQLLNEDGFTAKSIYDEDDHCQINLLYNNKLSKYNI